MGARVKISGLKAAQYNGLVGKVRGLPEEANGRVAINITFNGAAKSLALQQANLTVLPKAAKVKPAAAAPVATPSPAVAAKEDLPFVKGSMGADTKDSLRMPEVQSALNEIANDQSWLTGDFLNGIMSDPYFSKALKDPRLVMAMNEIAADPNAAKRKYAGNKELEEFIRKFMGLMGNQYSKIAELQQEEKAKEEKKKLGPTVQFGQREVLQSDLNRWMSDPRIRGVLEDPRTGHMLNLIQQDERNFEKYMNMPQMKLLLKEGVIETPAKYRL